MDLLIHVGFHKTATTWLQEELFDSGRFGFRPLCPQGTDSRWFGWEFLTGSGYHRHLEGRLATPFDFDALAVRRRIVTELRRRPAEDGFPVISHEDLSGHIWSGGFQKKEIADRLFAALPEARILITVREQIELIRSSYEHYLWYGGLASLKHYVRPHNEFQVPLFNPSHLLYDRLVGYYRSLFGSDRVLVLTYEDFCDRPEHFFDRLYRFAGLEPPRIADLPVIARRNARSSALAAMHHWLRPLNVLGGRNNLNARFAFGSGPLWRGSVAYASKFVPQALAEAQRRRNRALLRTLIGDMYDESNATLAAMTGIDLAGLGYRLASTPDALRMAAE